MLYQFLQGNNITATHFMIGIQILAFPQLFQFAFDTLQGDIAVHTWTHPYMTTLSNLEVLGQLGWTMQLMHDSTGGRLPRFWRPPYGDSDNRVRAIAQEVFGLQTIFWNQEYVFPPSPSPSHGVSCLHDFLLARKIGA
jgi:chitin deacetylase